MLCVFDHGRTDDFQFLFHLKTCEVSNSVERRTVLTLARYVDPWEHKSISVQRSIWCPAHLFYSCYFHCLILCLPLKAITFTFSAPGYTGTAKKQLLKLVKGMSFLEYDFSVDLHHSFLVFTGNVSFHSQVNCIPYLH